MSPAESVSLAQVGEPVLLACRRRARVGELVSPWPNDDAGRSLPCLRRELGPRRCRHLRHHLPRAADDPELLDLVARAPVTQQRPNLLLAAVHFLLFGGAPHPLGHPLRHRRGLSRDGSADPVAPVGHLRLEFKDFCMTHRDELLELIATGSTQTNEVGRCTALLPALSHIAAGYDRGQPLGLLDLGTSAGLNLLFDRYAYTYRRRDGGAMAKAITVTQTTRRLRPVIRPRPCGSSAPCEAGSVAAFPGGAVGHQPGRPRSRSDRPP